MKQFGRKERDKQYHFRPGVYGLLINEENSLAVIETEDGKFFLPGGGIEAGETHQECLKREAIEEMGMEIEVGPFIGSARQYFYSTNQYKYMLSEGHFYLCYQARLLGEPSEPGHYLRWFSLAKATEHLFHEYQVWAVGKVKNRLTNAGGSYGKND
ncbi:NUDIX domain-containing protein [Sediminibacillus dalangtanensis]|uniref:NUDIX domain-containing protein n=1 Tax=Sediminibacillus dalangtanensis TaxID=2729421 RepID=A0ABX7VR41_9BACI|nr:NUDIX domain-containing protein [Sediminibacillus dalangtanensis]QTM98973.1 NUDIX domain-containing protein [Sediminibacillus dalangtanensis]